MGLEESQNAETGVKVSGVWFFDIEPSEELLPHYRFRRMPRNTEHRRVRVLKIRSAS